jgi:hypothetical protein
LQEVQLGDRGFEIELIIRFSTISQMNNPIPDATKFVKSLNYRFTITGSRFEFQGSSICVAPSLDAVECSQVTMKMIPSKSPAGLRNSVLLFVVVNAIMGKTFDIEGFFAKFAEPPFEVITAEHDGTKVTFTPAENLWTIAFHPCEATDVIFAG